MTDIPEQKFDPERINQMSAAYKRLSAVTGTLTDGAEELKNLAPDVDLYYVTDFFKALWAGEII